MKLPFFSTTSNPSEKEGTRLNRKVVTFLFCIVVSAFFWVMMSLSKEYTIELNFPVSYINLPKDKVVANDLPGIINIDVKARGFSLLTYKLSRKKKPVQIDVNDSRPLRSKNRYYLLTNSKIDKVSSQLDDIKVVRVYPDTIFLNFSKKISKTVAVKANLKLEFNKLYQQSDSVKLNPSFIKISGAADLIHKINYVETELVSLKNIKDSLSLELKILRTPALKLIDLSQPTVHATVSVTKYTEATIELPIEVENLPSGYVLKLFPDKVSVKYDVAFQNYEKINALQFHAVVDYLKIEPGSNKLKVQLLKYPAEIRATKMNPEKVEYIIRK